MFSSFSFWSLVASVISVILFIIILTKQSNNNKIIVEEVSTNFRDNRNDSANSDKLLREEVGNNIMNISNAISSYVEKNEEKINKLIKSNSDMLDKLNTTQRQEFESIRKSLEVQLGNIKKEQEIQTTIIGNKLNDIMTSNNNSLDKIGKKMDDKFKDILNSNENKIIAMRNEVANGIKNNKEMLSEELGKLFNYQEENLNKVNSTLEKMIDNNNKKLDKIDSTLSIKVQDLQTHNKQELSEMRKIVEEKLEKTLNERITQSFKIISDSLNSVSESVGKMEKLAAGVGDLKKVLTKVQSRGAWGQLELDSILKDILLVSQFEKQVNVNPETKEKVDFAVKLPGRTDDPLDHIWLPIDSKYPQESYEKLIDAYSASNTEMIEHEIKELKKAILSMARSINKYIHPPNTTDFAIMFLPTESLFAEVLRIPGLADEIRHQHNVIITGPTTVSALLSSLRVGFETLKLQKSSSEIWKILGAVKTEFGKFETMLKKVKSHINDASNRLDDALGTRTNVMKRKLRKVEELSDDEAYSILYNDDDDDNDDI